MVTRTINQLHFEDLDPIRFEELILSMIYRMKKWNKLDHFGKKGADSGIDIRAIELLENGISNTYYFQCKRYKKINKTIIKNIVDDYIAKNRYIPQFYVLVVSCALTKDQIEYFESYCNSYGFEVVIVWTNSIIETKLYFEYPDLLFAYFGINLLSENHQMKLKRYDCLKDYLEIFNNNIEKFKYNGELVQTFFCLRDLFELSLDQFQCIEKMHKTYDYLFDSESKKDVYLKIDNIDSMISKYIEKFRNADVSKQQEIANQMNEISLQVYNFINTYVGVIKKQMSGILFDD